MDLSIAFGESGLVHYEEAVLWGYRRYSNIRSLDTEPSCNWMCGYLLI